MAESLRVPDIVSPAKAGAETAEEPAKGGSLRCGADRISQVQSFTLVGVEARTVTVEVSVRNGYPRTTIVGLPDASVLESRERVEAAIKASGLPFPDRRIIINLSPAELPKEGAIFDLPVALAILAESGRIPRDSLDGWAIAGELSLDGHVRPVRGVLAMAMEIAAQSDPAGAIPSQYGRRSRRFLIPLGNAVEAASVEGIDLIPVTHLREAVDALIGRPPMHDMPQAESPRPSVQADIDLSDVRGQPIARRALEVAVAGGHNLLLIGPPGGGKTLLAQRTAGILPSMTQRESIETTLIYSVAGMIRNGCGLIETRPFRAPHTSISGPGMIGGGPAPGIRPGEVSLAHNGVLFLDEMPEFAPATLNLLRQPLEDGRVSVTRARGGATFPARFTLVAAMNPCPCGYLGDSRKACHCTPTRIQQYRSRVSGPLLDRIDLHIEVPRVSLDALSSDVRGESSSAVRARVIAARAIQSHRFAGTPGVHANAQMGICALNTYAGPDSRGRALLRLAAERLGLSGRAYHRILRVARTIADLEGTEKVGEKHITEAIGYRVLDRSPTP